MKEEDFEKLGAFYLGRIWDIDHMRRQDDLLLYDSRDLVTHAVCIGMTGSGKTGLCLSLLEEAAIDGIPVIAIDPKGDIGNLLLSFPELRAEDFEPWVDEDEARRQGLSLRSFAEAQAASWREGLSDWGQTGDRIRRFKQSADFAIYTPGGGAGLPVSILKSLSAPDAALREDRDLLRQRIANTVTTLLALMGIESDPLRSKEHILLANIFNAAWAAGKDLDLSLLVQQIQKPPLTQIGAIDLESFFPARQRFELSMTLNNLLAAPGFEAWLEGQALDIDSFLYSADGRPRVSIFSISHLADSERMFFVSLLLNEILSWMRAQSGTSSLRALIYMDEIFGYFPPVANPPSKTPLITLLKQARAFGLGLVLATQNPVDLDYKGLSNTGTWFIGRLQTERDKARVLDGLEGAALGAGAVFDRQYLDAVLSGLGKRIFLMNNIHDSTPEIFQTRQALSYLRGPLTRQQIKLLMKDRKTQMPPSQLSIPENGSTVAPLSAQAEPPQIKNSLTGGSGSGSRPVLPPDISEYFLPVSNTGRGGCRLVYKPMIAGTADVRFADSKRAIDVLQKYCLLASVSGESVPVVNWQNALSMPVDISRLKNAPEGEAFFASLAPCMSQSKSYARWSKEFSAWLYASKQYLLLRYSPTGQTSSPGESERDFRIRIAQSAREERDSAVCLLKKKYAPRLNSLNERLRRAQQVAERQRLEAEDRQLQSAISLGTTLMGAFMGRKALSKTTLGRAAGTARGIGRAIKEKQDVTQAEDTVALLRQQAFDLDAEFNAEIAGIMSKFDLQTARLDTICLKPRKTDIAIGLMSLIWVPFWQDDICGENPAWS